eukprot:403371596
MDKFFSRRNMSLVRAYFRLIYIIFATVIIFAAAMLLVENQYINDHLPIIKAKQLANQSLPPSKQFYLTQDEKTMIEYQFHDMLYFMIISITTVGYGDIYPRTVYGQMMCIGIIIVILALIPSQLSEFSKVSNLTTIYSRKHYSNKGKKDAKHILLLGDASPEAIKTFLTECYHSDHGVTETNVVIMRNSPPSEEMSIILRSSNFENKVTYIEGNPIHQKDLKRCLADKAKCCVILSNQFCRNPTLEDQRNILNALAVKKYVRNQSFKEMRLCLQLVKPEHKDLYFTALLSTNKIDQVLCVEELKLQLLAKSSICPGIITIIWSLITSNTTGATESDNDDPETELLCLQTLQNEVKFTGEKSQTSKTSNSLTSRRVVPVPYPKQSNQQQKPGFYMDSKGVWKEKWQLQYESGTKYELYRVPLKYDKFEGLKFKDISMILYLKRGLILIALEIKIANQIKVFVNPTEYIFDSEDHYGYVIHHKNPEFDEINKIDLSRHTYDNRDIYEYINRQEGANTVNKKEYINMNENLAKLLAQDHSSTKQINYENFFSTKKPMPLNAARIKNKLDKSIEGHIIVCGIVKGIKNLILPLRSKTLGSQRRPIIILSNENLGDEDLNGDTFIWSEINRFEEIYIIKGSALNPADLERARVQKAKAIIILAKSYENQANSGGGGSSQNMLDADAIFMYKTIEANYKNVIIVTELAQMGAIAFLVQGGNEENYQKQGYFMSRPFASGEIYVSSLLDSLMCQAFYSPKITEILDQLIMGSANTPEKIPKKCSNLSFASIFESCLKHFNMIVIGVYKRHFDDANSNGQNQGEPREFRNNKKPYVWLHPPKFAELSIHDELFVLCDKDPKENIAANSTDNQKAEHNRNSDITGRGETSQK